MRSLGIDSRNYEQLIRQIRDKVPYYTPEWRFVPEHPDAGTALSMIFAKMFEETITRFNQVPFKNYIAFLNLLNAHMESVLPAHGYVTFSLSPGAPRGEYIKRLKQVFAVDETSEEKIIFETQDDVFVTPSNVTDVYNISTAQDKIFSAAYNGSEQGGYSFFGFYGSENLQEHSIYLAHNDILNNHHPSAIEVSFKNQKDKRLENTICSKLSKSDNSDWLYWSGGEWNAFDEVLAKDGRLLLIKKTKRKIENCGVNDTEKRWLCCRIKDFKEVSNFSFDCVKIRSGFLDKIKTKGIDPEKIFYNDIETNKTFFYPFGERFSLYDTMYIGSEEIFSKKGAEIKLTLSLDYKDKDLLIQMPEKEIKWKLVMDKSSFDEPAKGIISLAEVSWEYWNGIGWTKLFVDPEYEGIFSTGIKLSKVIRFKCPDDLEGSYVNAIPGYWIRARIVKINNPYIVSGYYRSPVIESIRLDYDYTESFPDVEGFITYNNMEHIDGTTLLKSHAGQIKPFYSFDGSKPSVLIGFDNPPVGAPVNMLFVTENYSEGEMPQLQWEYLKRAGKSRKWETLKVIDRTDSFKTTGIITFEGAKNFASCMMLGKEQYWIRIVDVNGVFDAPGNQGKIPLIKGIYLNSTPVVQQETVLNERFSIISGQQSKRCVLGKSPVLHEDVWVDEKGHLNADEMKKMLDEDINRIEEVRDESGALKELWVKWERTDDIFLSGENDRHYIIDEFNGFIIFGDGIRGRIPVSQENESIMISYTAGGGSKGNVGANRITDMGTPVAFVDSVFNPEATVGGCDRQSMDSAVEIGSKTVKHLDRAVTIEDFESLAKKSTNEVLKVKCLPNMNHKGLREIGAITVVILPSNYDMGRKDTHELREHIEDYLSERASGFITAGEDLRVIEPVYLKVSVSADIYVTDMDLLNEMESLSIERINSFLDPLSGNINGKGWGIGEIPLLTKFYSLLQNMEGVSRIERVILSGVRINSDSETDVDISEDLYLPFALVTSGTHRINIMLAV